MDDRTKHEVLEDQAVALEEEAASPLHLRVNGWKIVVFAVLTGLGIAVLFFLRASQTASADKRICAKVDKVTSALIEFIQDQPVPRVGSDDWVARTALLTKLRAAACDPHNLPSTPK